MGQKGNQTGKLEKNLETIDPFGAVISSERSALIRDLIFGEDKML